MVVCVCVLCVCVRICVCSNSSSSVCVCVCVCVMRWSTARVGGTNCVYYGNIGHSLHSMVTHLTITFLPLPLPLPLPETAAGLHSMGEQLPQTETWHATGD